MPDWLLLDLRRRWSGAAVGSFLNVCVYRLPAGESVVRPRSHCPQCDTAIAWHDNVPVLELPGCCGAAAASCGTRISPQYPLVEAVTALVWVAAAVRYGCGWQALAVAVFFTLLLGIALTDARTYIIPDEFTVGGTALGLALAFLPGGQGILQALLGGAARASGSSTSPASWGSGG